MLSPQDHSWREAEGVWGQKVFCVHKPQELGFLNAKFVRRGKKKEKVKKREKRRMGLVASSSKPCVAGMRSCVWGQKSWGRNS